MRDLSATALAAIFSEQTSELFLTLVRIYDSNDVLQWALVNDSDSVTSNGQAHDPERFVVARPTEDESGISGAVLNIDNVAQDYTQFFVESTARPYVKIEIVLRSEPNTILVGPEEFSIVGWAIGYDVLMLTLDADAVQYEPFPAQRMTPETTPALFSE